MFLATAYLLRTKDTSSSFWASPRGSCQYGVTKGRRAVRPGSQDVQVRAQITSKTSTALPTPVNDSRRAPFRVSRSALHGSTRRKCVDAARKKIAKEKQGILLLQVLPAGQPAGTLAKADDDKSFCRVAAHVLYTAQTQRSFSGQPESVDLCIHVC